MGAETSTRGSHQAQPAALPCSAMLLLGSKALNHPVRHPFQWQTAPQHQSQSSTTPSHSRRQHVGAAPTAPGSSHSDHAGWLAAGRAGELASFPRALRLERGEVVRRGGAGRGSVRRGRAAPGGGRRARERARPVPARPREGADAFLPAPRPTARPTRPRGPVGLGPLGWASRCALRCVSRPNRPASSRRPRMGVVAVVANTSSPRSAFSVSDRVVPGDAGGPGGPGGPPRTPRAGTVRSPGRPRGLAAAAQAASPCWQQKLQWQHSSSPVRQPGLQACWTTAPHLRIAPDDASLMSQSEYGDSPVSAKFSCK